MQGTVTALHTGEPVDGVCVALLPGDGDVFSSPTIAGFTGMQPDGTPYPGQYVVPSAAPGSYVLGVNPSQVTFLARLLDRVQRDRPFEWFGPGIPAPVGPPPAQLTGFAATPGAAAGHPFARSR